jgi:rhodanese-related sulfurtransferase
MVFAAGYPAWKEFAGASATAVTVKGGKEEGSIDIATFEKILKEKPDSILLIDVRDADDYKKGTFKTAVNIPTDDLEKKVKTLPSDKPIVFVCNTGAKSGEAFYMLKDLRPDLKEVYYLEAEVLYKKDGTYTIKKPK